MSIQDYRRALVVPPFPGLDPKEDLRQLRQFCSEVAQEVRNFHNAIQTGQETVNAAVASITHVWQTPWPLPVTYKVSCAFFGAAAWLTTWSPARSADGLSVVITTGTGAPVGGGTVLLIGVA